MLRLYSFVLLFHAYIGWRLLADMPFGVTGVVLATLVLIASASLIPLALVARQVKRQPLSDRLAWAGLLAMGFFSSLFVFTFLRDVGMLIGSAIDGVWLHGNTLQRFGSLFG